MLSFERAVSAVVVMDPQISPDGRWVAYGRTEASQRDEHPIGSIWLVEAETHDARPLTASEANDRAPRWTPDGRHIVFLSDRKQRSVAQLYLLPLSGGEAVQLTDVSEGIIAFAVSPDGSSVAFTARDPETDDERKRREERDDAKIIGEHQRRAGLWVTPLPADAATAALQGRAEPRRVSPEGLHVGGYVDAGFSWMPDSSELVILAGPSPATNDRINTEMFRLTLDGQTTSLGWFEGITRSPMPSPDGSTIAFIGAESEIPARFVLQAIPATGGQPKTVAPGYEGAFIDFQWLADSNRLLASTETGQWHAFLVADLDTGERADAWAATDAPGSSASGLSVSRDGSRCSFVWCDATIFNDVQLAELGGASRRLTDVNPWTAEHTFGELREVSWTSFDGLEIQGLLILPVGYEEGKRYPLLTHIHGGPAAAWNYHLYASVHDWGQFLAQRGYAVFMPNPRGSTGRGTSFLSSIANCYGEPDWQDIDTGVDHLIERGIADPDRLVVGGWSGGGFLTNWAITHTDRFKAAVSVAGTSNWLSYFGTADIRAVFERYVGRIDQDPENAWRLSPVRYVNNASTPTLIIFGEQDPRVPVWQGHELHQSLKRRGVETQMVVYPREGHGIGERKHQLDLLQRVIDWYERHLDVAKSG